MFSAVAYGSGSCGSGVSGSRNKTQLFSWTVRPELFSPVSKYLKLVNSTITFENKNKTYRQGELISGSVTVPPLLQGMSPQEINGLYIEFVGGIFSTKNEKRYFFNYGSIGIFQRFYIPLKSAKDDDLKHIKPLKEGQYRFAFKVPDDDCHETFVGKYGSAQYRIKCGVDQTTDGCYWHDVTIISKPVRQWKNHKQMIEPMFAKKTFSSILMFGGKIQIMVNTDQNCYQPGACISLALKVENGSGESIKDMTMQLQQTVHYNLAAFIQITSKLLLPTTNYGRSVPSGTTQNWNGHFKLPDNLLPSIESAQSKMIAFEYSLRVTLLMGGSLLSNMSQDFPIHIGRSLLEQSRSTKKWKSAYASVVSRQAQAHAQAVAHSSRNLLPVEQSMMSSMASLEPSLPDYETATCENKTINDMPPLSYALAFSRRCNILNLDQFKESFSIKNI